MIEIIPSISVMGGQLVRLEQGDYSRRKTYHETPLEVAKKFEDHGIRKIHLIDLDGARKSQVINYDTLDLIKSHTNLVVDFGGGVSNDGDLIQVFEAGADRVTVGSLAISNPTMVISWLISYGRNKLTISADYFNEKIRIKGWQKQSEIDLFDHIEYYYQRSVQYVKCSDISRDGLLQGPSINTYTRILQRFSQIKLVASGGVGSIDDIKALEQLGAYGVILGKAFYDDKIKLAELDQFIAKGE